MSAAVRHPALTRRALGMLLLALAVAAAPHASHLPPGIVVFVLACGAWRWMIERAGWPLPGRTLRAVLTVAALSAVMLVFGTVFGRDAGTALLAVMLGLKLLEVRGYRDAMLTLFLGCFFVVVMAFHSQEIPVAAALVLALLLLMATMIELNRGDAPRTSPPRGPMSSLRPAAFLLLAAAPLAAFMFVMFPRLPTPLWGLPSDAHGKTTGLSETMSPGAISELATSDAIAFRALFEDEPPAPADLYWRGPVLWFTDGRNWSAPAGAALPAPDAHVGFIPMGEPVHYSVMLEPTGQSWLFALDLPYSAPAGSAHTADLFLLARQPVREPRRYAVTSYPAYRTPELTATERERALQLPPANPRTVALGRSWREGSASPEEAMRRALAHFRFEAFHYTLSPPALAGGDPLDEFLFETRAGFCEHYAAAFTVLMRAAGVPARVVTGYQGGERNTVGGHLVVRQRDAHAWAEVWLPPRGWTRIDPTAAVAPERIARGSADMLERSGMSARRGFGTGRVGDLVQRAGAGWDALNTRWNAWVLAYGPDAQSALLARIGLRSWLTMTLALAGIVAIVLVLLALATRRRRPRDPLAEMHARFRARLARRGIVAEPSEGPVAFASRVRRRNPELGASVDVFTGLYVAMRYGKNHAPSDLRRLRRAMANLGH